VGFTALIHLAFFILTVYVVYLMTLQTNEKQRQMKWEY